MKSVENVSGNANFNNLERLLIVIISAYISFAMLNYINVKPILESLIPLKVPFKGLAILGGFSVIFWVVLAYRICGKGYGIAVALLTVSLCLFISPWYEIVRPYWFGIVGFVSFAVMGILAEKLNGGIALTVCMLINWISFSVYVMPVDFKGVAILSVAAFISGIIGDLVARKVSKIRLPTVL